MTRSTRWDLAYLYFMFVGTSCLIALETSDLLGLSAGATRGLAIALTLLGLGAAAYRHRKLRLDEFAHAKSVMRLRRRGISERAPQPDPDRSDEGSV